MFLTLGAGVAAVISLGVSLYALKETLQGEFCLPANAASALLPHRQIFHVPE